MRTQQEGDRLQGCKGAYPPAMMAPWSQTLSPQNCEKEKFVVEASQVLYLVTIAQADWDRKWPMQKTWGSRLVRDSEGAEAVGRFLAEQDLLNCVYRPHLDLEGEPWAALGGGEDPAF